MHNVSHCYPILLKKLISPLVWNTNFLFKISILLATQTLKKSVPSVLQFLTLLGLSSPELYSVIHNSLRDFRPLRYSSRDGHAEGEHVNRGRDTPSFCPTLQLLDMLTSEGSWQTFLAHARQSRPMAPAGLFVSQRTGNHSAGISCTTHELFSP